MILQIKVIKIIRTKNGSQMAFVTAADQTGNMDLTFFPNAYKRFENEITLPLHTKLTDEEVEYVIKQFSRIVKEYI